MNKIAIIGGGASGLTAAISAAVSGADVTIFERLDRVGKKLLSTGNGRCNLTNCAADTTYYYGNKRFIQGVLSQFSVNETLNFFTELGLITRNENGKIYPYSLQAGTVVDLLRFACDRYGVKFNTGIGIAEISPDFTIENECFDCVIVATGGKASPHLGSDGSGYKLLENFGHHLTELTPAITQVKTDTKWIISLKGIKFDGNASIKKNGKILREESGEILFTEYGLSGPPILQLSRIAGRTVNTKITLDFMPEFSYDSLFKIIKSRKKIPTGLFENLFTGILNKRLGQTVVKFAGFSLCDTTQNLNNADIAKLVSAVKEFTLQVTGTKGFSGAQVTAGGIDTRDFNLTMESKLKPRLYSAGEILDVDGDCGGYNLQWAFSSGFIAGLNAAKG